MSNETSLICDICEVISTNKVSHQQHLKGRRHAINLRKAASGLITRGDESQFIYDTESDEIDYTIPSNAFNNRVSSLNRSAIVKTDQSVFCDLCNVRLTSRIDYERHCVGRNHQSILNSMTNDLQEKISKLSVSNQHTQTESIKNSNGLILCDLCNTKMTEKDYEKHINGRRHKANLDSNQRAMNASNMRIKETSRRGKFFCEKCNNRWTDYKAVSMCRICNLELQVNDRKNDDTLAKKECRQYACKPCSIEPYLLKIWWAKENPSECIQINCGQLCEPIPMDQVKDMHEKTRSSQREFLCEECNNQWTDNKAPSECKRIIKPGCGEFYDPIPKDQEYGWGKFKCACGNGFNGYIQMGATAKCYKCRKSCLPEKIIESERRDHRKSRNNHSCVKCNGNGNCPFVSRIVVASKPYSKTN